MKTAVVGACAAVAWACLAPMARAADFSHAPPGELVPGSGMGRVDETLYAPGMRFPMKSGPAFANSQVYGPGGLHGGGGGQCDPSNYAYPWRDNYCETRSHDMPLCPAGSGHQGQDIRPGLCQQGADFIVAAQAGVVTNVGSYSIYVTAPDGTRFDYLHGSDVLVSVGQEVAKGQRLATVSNNFGGTATTIHLHFNIRQNVDGYGSVFVPPYTSLVESYKELLGIGANVSGELGEVDCARLRGWAHDEDSPGDAVAVQVYFGGSRDDPEAVGIEVLADRHRDELCDALGACEHGFEIEVPLSLRDAAPHAVHVYAVGVDASEVVELEGSPARIECPVPALPSGVRRPIGEPAVLATWGLSTLWQMIRVDEAALETLPLGRELPYKPVLVRSDDPRDDGVWLMDPGYRRPIASEAVADAWGLDQDAAQVWPAYVLADVPIGTPLRSKPLLVRGDGPEIFVVDDVQCPIEDGALDPTCSDAPDEEREEDDDESGDDGRGVGDGSSAGETTGGDDGAALGGGAAQGCGCDARGTKSWSWWLVLVVLGPRRVRRARRPIQARSRRPQKISPPTLDRGTALRRRRNAALSTAPSYQGEMRPVHKLT